MGRRPFRRENAKPPEWQTLGSCGYVVVRPGIRKRREGRFGERDLGSIFGGGSAQEVGSPREQEVPVRTKPSDSKEGHGLPDGSKPLERRCQAHEV